MYVVIEKNTGKIVLVISSSTYLTDDHALDYQVQAAARKLAIENPGKTYYAAYLYLEIVSEPKEITSWTVS